MSRYRIAKARADFFVFCLLPIAVGWTSIPQSGKLSNDGATGRGTTARTQRAEPPAIRRVWSGPLVDGEGKPSPDGRFLTATDWSTGDQVLYDIAAGKMIRLTNKGSWAQSQEFAEASAMSPDGKTVVFGWFSMAILGFELRAMSIAGADSGTLRTIYRPAGGAFVSPQSFTSDSRRVAVKMQLPGSSEIVLISLDGGAPTTLKTFDWRTPGGLQISPDNRWLAYDFAPDQKQPDRDIYVMALDGSRETVVMQHKGSDQVLGWTPSGAHLLVASERGGTPGVWALPMSNGKSQGEPVLVRADLWRIMPIGVTAKGSVFYGVPRGERDLYTAAFDPVAGKVVSQPVSATGGTLNASDNTVAFSPDGQHVAYLVTRGSSLNFYSPLDIVLRSLEHGEVRRFSPDLARINRLHWMSDGRSILIRGADQKARSGIYRLTLDNGSLSTVYQSPRGFHQEFTVSRDGSRLYFAQAEQDMSVSYVNALDIAGGSQRVVYTAPRGHQYWGAALSPDERSLAVAFRYVPTPGSGTSSSYIAVITLESGTAREVYAFPESDELNTYSGVTWSSDGYIYFGASLRRESSGRIEIRRVAATGGPATSIGLKPGPNRAFRVSPDGRRIAYGAGFLESEIWVMSPPDLTSTTKPSSVRR